ncbi:DsbA family protein [Nocardia nova]|nr:thioredoxin domain-containing protein [Nocardia nova]
MSKKSSSQLLKGSQSSRSRILVQVCVAVVLILLIGAIGVSIAVKKSHKDRQEADRVAAAKGPDVIAGTGLRVGNPDSKVVVSIVEDLQCPSCKLFEDQASGAIEEMIGSGKVAIEYRTISFLDRASSTNYSSRAANASACVAEADMSKWFSWHQAMFKNQPEENSAGLPDDRLIAIAREQGVNGQGAADCIANQKYADFVKSSTKKWFVDAGIQGTPTVFVNGAEIHHNNDPKLLPSVDDLKAAVAKAQV